MKRTKAFIVFHEASDIVEIGDAFQMELPDFREHEPNYTEENRKAIKKFYSEVADSHCSIVFEFEVPKKLATLSAIPTEDLESSNNHEQTK